MNRPLYLGLSLSALAVALAAFGLWRGLPTARDKDSGDPAEIQRLQERIQKLEKSSAEPEAGVKTPGEFAWAKLTAGEFLDCIRTDNLQSAMNLTGSEFRAGYQGTDLHNFLIQMRRTVAKGYEITDEQLAPSRDEVLFKGLLKGESTVADFILRMGKEKKDGAWRVRSFRYEQRTK